MSRNVYCATWWNSEMPVIFFSSVSSVCIAINLSFNFVCGIMMVVGWGIPEILPPLFFIILYGVSTFLVILKLHLHLILQSRTIEMPSRFDRT